MSVTPVVAIVGRPNVGKSTLFNRLMGERRAIVHNRPGVTRDRVSGLAELIDDLVVMLIDTGGLVPGEDSSGLNRQVLMAVEESDLMLLVVDGKSGLTTADETVWQELRPLSKPVILVVNKADTRAAQEGLYEFYRLGIEHQVLVSAEHNQAIAALREQMIEMLPSPEVSEPAPGAPRLAIVGRPNVGKSSLLNRLVGEERALVSPEPGTTRDPIDSLLVRDGERFLLVDTAGIRRRSRTANAPEELAVMLARRQLERADLALLVVDAAAGVTSGDLAIAGTAWQLGRACVVLINKWDLLNAAGRERLEVSWQRLAEVLAEPPRVNISALTGRGIDKILPTVKEVLSRFRVDMGTAAVNRLFAGLVERHQPPTLDGHPWKLLYATQVKTQPPTFMLFASRGLPRKHPYRRYLENALRGELELAGVPIRLVVRHK